MIDLTRVLIYGTALYYLVMVTLDLVLEVDKWAIIFNDMKDGTFLDRLDRVLRGKPFNCPLCLTFWIGLALYYFLPYPLVVLFSLMGIALVLHLLPSH